MTALCMPETQDDTVLSEGDIRYAIILYGEDYENHDGFHEWKRRLNRKKIITAVQEE